MVRVNLIHPKRLADQHLVAEYNEILMLLGHLRKHGIKSDIPNKYSLGKGHINFFKNKLIYLRDRHEQIKKEMKKRKFAVNVSVNINEFDKELHNSWKPDKKDIKLIKERLVYKINNKPRYYRYYGNKKDRIFFLDLLT
ncbi:MAG: pyrimidine dimer DNA glycosylase/endonuclease V [Nanoarchaeota archaeon]